MKNLSSRKWSGLDAASELLDLFEAFDALEDSMYESPGYLNPPIVTIPLKYGLESDKWVAYTNGIKSGAQYTKQVRSTLLIPLV